MGDTWIEGVNALVCLKDKREKRRIRRLPTVGGRDGVCVCVCVCVCVYGYGCAHTHTGMHPGAAGFRLMVDRGQGRLHGEGDGAK